MKNCLILGLLTALPVLGAERHSFTFHDMLALDRLSDPVVSPNGRWVAFVATDYSLEKNRGNQDIWMVSSKGSHLRRLTTHLSADNNPVFSKDGKTLYFLGTRGDSSQIHALPLAGGEAVQVTAFPVGVRNLKLSPDGTHFSFTAAVYADESDFDKVAERDRKQKANPSTALVFESLFVRHWDTWEDDRWNHLFVMPASGGSPVDLMEGLAGNCPSKPFGGLGEYAWSPDSKRIAYVTKLGRDRAWTTDFDIFIHDINGKTTVELTGDNRAWDTEPCFSPDGKSLYYLAMRKPGYESDRFRLMQLDLATGRKLNLTEQTEVSWSELTMAPDGQTLYCLGEKEASMRLYAIELATGKARELVSEHYNQSLTFHEGKLYFLQDSLTGPAELYQYSLHTGNLKKLTGLNDAMVQAIEFSVPERFWCQNRDGDKIRGWLLKPVPFNPTNTYPLAFYIHGGPQGSWQDHFHYRWNLQILPAQGYVVVAIDFRGSTGYGDDFREAISGHYGDRPFHDLMDGLDHVLKTYPFIDAERMVALGASYGGYMINWIAGNAPDRFRCLVNHDGVFDTHAFYFNTDELWFPEHDQLGTPFESPEHYDKFSPARFVKNWKTPMLVIHGARDYRVVDTDAISTFNALQRKGIPSQLIYFPDENHFVLKPRNSEFWHRSVIEWLHRWCKMP